MDLEIRNVRQRRARARRGLAIASFASHDASGPATHNTIAATLPPRKSKNPGTRLGPEIEHRF
jgi:hypothetical protein